MTIDEAVAEMQNEIDEHPSCGELPYYKALKLGIEALKRHKWNRTHSFIKISHLLPGETEK
jgi:hypothetical protein